MWKIVCMAVALLMCLSGRAEAQFSMLIPSSSTVMEDKESSLKLDVFSAYPMEMRGLDMQPPKSLTVTRDGKGEDLKAMRKPATIIGHQAWRAVYEVKQPCVYQFAMESAPYFDPEEDRFIIHYTKTVVAAFGDEKGWDVPLGLKMEIIPLTRPFANYSGNIFQGRVLLDGKPVPGAEVEVEYYNCDDLYTTPNVYFMTQVIKTDENGVFTYCAPWPGWWGFAALKTDRKKMEHQGALKDVELGAVIWMEFTAPLKR